jgi:hypothetical protein
VQACVERSRLTKGSGICSGAFKINARGCPKRTPCLTKDKPNSTSRYSQVLNRGVTNIREKAALRYRHGHIGIAMASVEYIENPLCRSFERRGYRVSLGISRHPGTGVTVGDKSSRTYRHRRVTATSPKPHALAVLGPLPLQISV